MEVQDALEALESPQYLIFPLKCKDLDVVSKTFFLNLFDTKIPKNIWQHH